MAATTRVGGLTPAMSWQWLRRRRLRCLMYHRISDDAADRLTVSPHLFAEQMAYLTRGGWCVLSLSEALNRLSSAGDLHKTVVLTFDDGYRDFLVRAAPVLLDHHYTATLFVVTGHLDHEAHWNSIRPQIPLLSHGELLELRVRGFGLGSHTVSHPDLTILDAGALEEELKVSRAAMVALGETFFPFAYPGGRFTQRERDAVEHAGYDCAVIVGGRWGNGRETDSYLLKREPMLASDTLSRFKQRVNGYYEFHYLWARARGVQTR
jgi:peptidoglycan/xylan/chitin deacetylase (PgdA/CDA1 family)